MSATTNPRPWRDLADQLTSDQVKWLERFERQDHSANSDVPSMAAAIAPDYVEHNEAAARYADVAPPAGATKIDACSRFRTGYRLAV
jgi:hypothetical protein